MRCGSKPSTSTRRAWRLGAFGTPTSLTEASCALASIALVAAVGLELDEARRPVQCIGNGLAHRHEHLALGHRAVGEGDLHRHRALFRDVVDSVAIEHRLHLPAVPLRHAPSACEAGGARSVLETGASMGAQLPLPPGLSPAPRQRHICPGSAGGRARWQVSAEYATRPPRCWRAGSRRAALPLQSTGPESLKGP